MERFDELRLLVNAVRRRWLTAISLRTFGVAAAVTAAPLAFAPLVAWGLSLQGALLIAVIAASLLTGLACGAFALWRRPGRPSDLTIARFIEERAAELNLARLEDSLVSAFQVADSPGRASDPFAGAVVTQAAARSKELPPESLVPHTAIRRSAFQAAAGTAFLAVAIVMVVPVLVRAADAAWLALFPQRVTISVEPGDIRVAAGGPLRIRAVLKGRGATLHGVAPMLVVSANEQQKTVPMAQDGDGYQFAFESVDRSFSYKVTVAALASRSYSVTAIFPPRVRRIDLQYDYPSFTGLPRRTDEDAGDIYAPAGTEVRVRIHTDKPVTAGELALSSKSSMPLQTVGDRLVAASLTLSKDDSYRIRLTDGDGLRSTGDTEYFIRVMDDRPPEVRILRPSADQSITPLEEVSIEARADDDYGVAKFELVYSVAGGKEQSTPFATVTGTSVARIGTYLLAAEDLRVQPGDVVAYYARAVDVGRGRRPTETRSDMFFLEVKPFGEEFVAAQSQAMGGGAAAGQLENLIAAQKEIINATWNLERRSGAGKSAEDAQAVAQAQAELKTRAEQMAASSRRNFRNPFMPERVSLQQPPRDRGAAPDPIGTAVQAMTRAIEQLQGQRMREALPHEMAALRGLLQAQAEVRRRQVQQSANGAAQGGTSRVGQDLSALFDRELQRQQRTNYESRSQIDERPDDRDDNRAMDRIRDLARRQEDLSRRQRELAEAGLPPEELKRQLETLTREQEALRAQAEALQRELDAKGSKSSRDSAAGSSGGLRNALDQMRQGAGDMRRQDARSAAQRSRDAADALRRAEQQLRGNTPDGRQRAAGELQLEAQQIAEAQRRIAAETSRLQNSGPGSAADALRRLASEKEKLAERVEALERAARQLGAQAAASAAADPAARAREAAGILEREQVGRRMRESAKGLQEAGGTRGMPEKQVQTEQEIARATDRAAAALGGATASTQALSDQLDQTRAMRDRLNKLEQQVRDAESRERESSRGARSTQRRAGDEGREGKEGRQGSTGSGQPGELQRLRQEYSRELQRTRDALSRLDGEPRSGQGTSTPETHEFSRSAPGTEAFKQDYSGWETLRRDVDLALERYEASLSQRLDRAAADRLAAGGSDRVPDAYRPSIARYYQSLAKRKK